MSLFTFFADLRGVSRELRRIADALDRAFPTTQPAAPAEPDDITYADDDRLAVEELREQARRLGILDEEEEEDVHS